MDELKQKYRRPHSVPVEKSELGVHLVSQSTSLADSVEHIPSRSEHEIEELTAELTIAQNTIAKYKKTIADLEHNAEQFEQNLKDLEVKTKKDHELIERQSCEILELKAKCLNESIRLKNNKDEEILKLKNELELLVAQHKKDINTYQNQLKCSVAETANCKKKADALQSQNQDLEENLQQAIANEFTEELKRDFETYKMLSETMKEDLSLESSEKDNVGFKLNALVESITGEKQALKNEVEKFDASLQELFNNMHTYESDVYNAIPEEYRKS